MFIRLSALCLCVSAVLLASCAGSFNRDWKKAGSTAAGDGKGSVAEGRWSGTWRSESTGHTGKLRCVVGPAKNAAGDHDFHYHATWMGFLSGSYKATHRVKNTRTGARFTGEHMMPRWAGGLYSYEGTITGDTFHARYRSAADTGEYVLKRMR